MGGEADELVGGDEVVVAVSEGEPWEVCLEEGVWDVLAEGWADEGGECVTEVDIGWVAGAG